MRFSKGKVKNINKKIVSGLLAITLTTAGLSGCSKYVSFDYSINDQGEYQVNGTVDYELLKDCTFIVIENKKYNVDEFYIGRYARSNYEGYYNVFNNQSIINLNIENERQIVYFETLENYLYATNNIKDCYTVEDVELILELMKENYLKENNKQLVKEK